MDNLTEMGLFTSPLEVFGAREEVRDSLGTLGCQNILLTKGTREVLTYSLIHSVSSGLVYL